MAIDESRFPDELLNLYRAAAAKPGATCARDALGDGADPLELPRVRPSRAEAERPPPTNGVLSSLPCPF